MAMKEDLMAIKKRPNGENKKISNNLDYKNKENKTNMSIGLIW